MSIPVRKYATRIFECSEDLTNEFEGLFDDVSFEDVGPRDWNGKLGPDSKIAREARYDFSNRMIVVMNSEINGAGQSYRAKTTARFGYPHFTPEQQKKYVENTLIEKLGMKEVPDK